MTDPTPDYGNRLAAAVSLLLDPFVVAPMTLVMLLDEVPRAEALGWITLIVIGLLAPLAVGLVLMRRRGRYAYQRASRGPLYALAWASILLLLLLAGAQQAPRVFIACLATLAVWVPLQYAVNRWLTKISIHTAVITGCASALIVASPAPSLVLVALSAAAVALVGWARVVTRHHTLPQVALGVLVGLLPVLFVFRWTIG